MKAIDAHYNLGMVSEEVRIQIPGSDRRIHATLDEIPGAPVVVFSHGLAASRDSTQFYNGAIAAINAGCSSLRFDFYGCEDDQRKLLDCTIWDHVADLDAAVRYLKEKDESRDVIVVGHSIGALAAILSKEHRYDALVLWDPTHPASWPGADLGDETTIFEPSLDMFRLRWGVDVLVTSAFLQSCSEVDAEAQLALLQKPLLIVAAGGGVLVPFGRRYLDAARKPKTFAIIDGADHGFLRGDSLARLYETTFDWITQL